MAELCILVAVRRYSGGRRLSVQTTSAWHGGKLKERVKKQIYNTHQLAPADTADYILGVLHFNAPAQSSGWGKSPSVRTGA